MAKIRYKNVNGGWTQISASDIGAASDDLIARGVGKPIISNVQTNIKNDTVLYIDQNDYDGDKTTITKLNTFQFQLKMVVQVKRLYQKQVNYLQLVKKKFLNMFNLNF